MNIYKTPPKIIYGKNSLQSLENEIKKTAAKKVLVITESFFLESSYSDKLEDYCKNAGAESYIYNFRFFEPSIESIRRACQFAQDIDADMIIGIGGGTPMDTAKIVSILLTNDIAPENLIGIEKESQLNPGKNLILMPTTAGTGSEMANIAIINDSFTGERIKIINDNIHPNTVILFPELTLSLPPHVTAFTGMDALIHAMEAYTSNQATYMTDILAEGAMKLIHNNIIDAFNNGKNPETRSNMLEGSMLAGKAFANTGFTAVHAFAYAIGAEFNIPHGIANTIMLPAVFDFNFDAKPNKFSRIAEILGVDVKTNNYETIKREFIFKLESIIKALQLPHKLSEYGIKEKDLPTLSASLLKLTKWLDNNAKVINYNDALNIYSKVL